MTDIAKDGEIGSAAYKTLLESAQAIPWKIDWKTMRFAYIRPQIEGLSSLARMSCCGRPCVPMPRQAAAIQRGC